MNKESKIKKVKPEAEDLILEVRKGFKLVDETASKRDVLAQFGDVNQRFNRIDSRLDSIDDRLDGVERGFCLMNTSAGLKNWN